MRDQEINTRLIGNGEKVSSKTAEHCSGVPDKYLQLNHAVAHRLTEVCDANDAAQLAQRKDCPWVMENEKKAMTWRVRKWTQDNIEWIRLG